MSSGVSYVTTAAPPVISKSYLPALAPAVTKVCKFLDILSNIFNLGKGKHSNCNLTKKVASYEHAPAYVSQSYVSQPASVKIASYAAPVVSKVCNPFPCVIPCDLFKKNVKCKIRWQLLLQLHILNHL